MRVTIQKIPVKKLIVVDSSKICKKKKYACGLHGTHSPRALKFDGRILNKYTNADVELPLQNNVTGIRKTLTT